MATLKEIRQALVDVLSAAPALATIKTWHKVDGFVPDRRNPTGSVGAGNSVYEQIDNDQDEATTDLPVYLAVVDPDPERAEDAVQELGEEARLVLVADNPTLGGVVSSTVVNGLDFTTAQDDNNLLVHFVTLHVTVTHFVARYRAATEPPADELVVTTEVG